MSHYYWDSGASTSTGSNWYIHDTSTSNVTFYVMPVLRPRRILVTIPEHWKDDDTMAFVKLVNMETKTGWLVTMVIKGDIIITDPNIETRTMEEFVPLLRWAASRNDNAKIDMFFDEHPFIEDTCKE